MGTSSCLRRSGLFLLLCGLVASAAIWYLHQSADLSSDLLYGNGRLEATEVDVATKIAGKIASVMADEGNDVEADHVIAQLEVNDLLAQLRVAEAQIIQAQQGVDEAISGVASAESQYQLAKLTLDRANRLMSKNFISKDQLDQARSTFQVTKANLNAAQTRVKVASAAVNSAKASADVIRTTLRDASLTAPIAGRVLYRLAEPGEVLAAGSKVVTLLNMQDVFMSVYLSAADSGQLSVGSQARIVLDALPEPIPAQVVYVAPHAQFTPKEVETRNEREKLMFRVKIRVDPDWLKSHTTIAKPGMPGVAYIRRSADSAWPAQLPQR